MADYDFSPGLDISSLTSVTQAQLMQMVAQIAPLAGVGGVLAFAGASGGAAGVGYPSVVANPRHVRYVWIDTQNIAAGTVTIRTYKGVYPSDQYADWASAIVAAGSITTAMLSNISNLLPTSTEGIPLSMIKVNTGYTDSGFGTWFVKVSSDGKRIEAVIQSSAIVDLTLAQIAKTGGVAVNGTGAAVLTSDGSTNLFRALINADLPSGIAVSKLAAGTNTYLLQTVGGVPTWTIIDSALVQNIITLDKLGNNVSGSGVGAQYQVPMMGAGLVATWQSPVKVFTSAGVVLAVNQVTFNAVVHNLTNGAGASAMPDGVRVLLKNSSGGALYGYANGEYVDVTGSAGLYYTLSHSTTTFTVATSGNGIFLIPKAGGAGTNITYTQWTMIVQLYKFNAANAVIP